jgi:hypothetical protein
MNLLQTKHLADFRAKNKPKTNSILSAKSADRSEKTGSKYRLSGDTGWELGARHRGQVESCVERGDPPPAFDSLRKPPLDLLAPSPSPTDRVW